MSASLHALHDAHKNRRTVYTLNNQLPVAKQSVIDAVEHAILHTPSSFNSQSTRILVLFGEEHQKLWDMCSVQLKAIVGDGDFSATKDKMASFRAAAGTILFYEDQTVVKELQKQFPTYADSFPVWSEHTNAMHQYAIWVALRQMGIGANLQHYAPVFEKQVANEFNVSSNWQLIAQMPFGGIVEPAGEKSFKPVSERMRVLG